MVFFSAIETGIVDDSTSESEYVRPSDWLPLPILTAGEQRFVGLHTVFNHDSNFVALSCSGDYIVDWGDGTVNNYTSGVTAEHIYDYANSALDGTESSKGYKQAIVSVTMQSGQTLTSINLQRTHSLKNTAYATGWLDINAVGNSINSYDLGGTIVRHALIEKINFIGTNVISDFSNFYRDCFSAQSFPVIDTSSGTNFINFYRGCYSGGSARINAVSVNFSVADMKLSSNALEGVFNGLSDLTTSTTQTITITGNWGASLLSATQRDIALNKNWTIID